MEVLALDDNMHQPLPGLLDGAFQGEQIQPRLADGADAEGLTGEPYRPWSGHSFMVSSHSSGSAVAGVTVPGAPFLPLNSV